jgi:hypothetical protein
LTDVFGRSVHGSFIHLYAKPASQGIWKPLVDREQLTSDELLCGLYSRACNHNLCGLFRLAGFEVAQSKVQGLKDALASAPRP